MVLVISKLLQILGHQARISNFFLDYYNIFFSQKAKTIIWKQNTYQAFFQLNLIVFGFQDAWDPKDEEEDGEEEENGEKDMETQEDNKENTNTKEKAGHDENNDDKDRNDDDAKVSV